MTTATTTFQMGKRELELGGKYLGLLRDANDLLGDVQALRARMKEDGYLLLRGLQPREKVYAARMHILECLDANGQIDRSHPLEQGAIPQDGRGLFLGGQRETTRAKPFLDLVESPEIMAFFTDFLGGQALTLDWKWLRAVGRGQSTGAHYDVVYMGRGTLDLYTAWTPLGDISYEHGPLALLEGSHNLPAYRKIRETYGKMDVDRDNIEGQLGNDPIEWVDRYGGRWKTTEFEMGDVLIFGMFSMHASIRNQTDRYRLSCDTRFQLASEPVDERWVGENPKAHYAWGKTPTRSMQDARKDWGI